MIGSNFTAAGVGTTYSAPRVTVGSVADGGPSASASPLSYLTADDRDVIARATGVVIGPDGRNQHGNGTAPILALELAHDRKTGRLPAGQPITSTYLTSRFHTAGGDVDFAASVNAMLQDIGMRAGEDRLDLRA